MLHIMNTVAETAVFQRYAAEIWTDDEREAFVNWIASNRDAGDVIPDPAAVGRCAGAAREWASAAVRG